MDDKLEERTVILSGGNRSGSLKFHQIFLYVELLKVIEANFYYTRRFR